MSDTSLSSFSMESLCLNVAVRNGRPGVVGVIAALFQGYIVTLIFFLFLELREGLFLTLAI